MRHISALLLALTLVSPVAACADQPDPVAQALLKRISSDGGHKVLRDLWEHGQEFGRVISGIESGDPSWLEVATALRPFSDAGASLSLNYAVALALPKAPDRVLALVGHGFELNDICTSPFIEPDPGIAEAYEREALDALATSKDSNAADCAQLVRLPVGA